MVSLNPNGTPDDVEVEIRCFAVAGGPRDHHFNLKSGLQSLTFQQQAITRKIHDSTVLQFSVFRW